MVYAPPSTKALSNLSQQPEEFDKDGWVSDQSSPEDVQTKVQPRAEKCVFTGGSSRKHRADDHRPSIPHHHPRVSLLTQIDTSVSTVMGTAPSAPSLSAGPESPFPRFPLDIVDDDPRRPHPHLTFAACRKLRHLRIISLRGGEAGGVSPACSIRWADGSGQPLACAITT